jgi:hypothetical protein
MSKLLILSFVALLAITATGCFHRNARCGGLFGFGQTQQYQYQAAAAPCCDPCAGGGMIAPVTAAPMVAPCCP